MIQLAQHASQFTWTDSKSQSIWPCKVIQLAKSLSLRHFQELCGTLAQCEVVLEKAR